MFEDVKSKYTFNKYNKSSSLSFPVPKVSMYKETGSAKPIELIPFSCLMSHWVYYRY